MMTKEGHGGNENGTTRRGSDSPMPNAKKACGPFGYRSERESETKSLSSSLRGSGRECLGLRLDVMGQGTLQVRRTDEELCRSPPSYRFLLRPSSFEGDRSRLAETDGRGVATGAKLGMGGGGGRSVSPTG